MLQIALVADKHDDDVRVGVVAELLEPPRDIDVRRVLGDVVDEQRANRATVVSACGRRPAKRGRIRRRGDHLRGGNSAVAFLPS